MKKLCKTHKVLQQVPIKHLRSLKGDVVSKDIPLEVRTDFLRNPPSFRLEPRSLPPQVTCRVKGKKLRKRCIKPFGKTGILFRHYTTLNTAQFLYEIWAVFTCAQASMNLSASVKNNKFAKRIYYDLHEYVSRNWKIFMGSDFVLQSLRVLSINLRQGVVTKLRGVPTTSRNNRV